MKWLINDENEKIFGMKLPTGFQLIGQTTLKEYQAWVDYFDRRSKATGDIRQSRITKRAYARVGVSSRLYDISVPQTRSLKLGPVQTWYLSFAAGFYYFFKKCFQFIINILNELV